MDYVRFGSTGLTVSRLCLGCMTYGDPGWREWVLDEETSLPLIREALESGINFFDTADMYSLGRSEEVVGRALKDMARREEVVIATKVYNPMGPKPNQKGLSRKHILEAINASLKRLGTDYVDLYIIHRFDPNTPVEETIEALDDVVRAGKALYLGASSMWAWQFIRACQALSHEDGRPGTARSRAATCSPYPMRAISSQLRSSGKVCHVGQLQGVSGPGPAPQEPANTKSLKA